MGLGVCVAVGSATLMVLTCNLGCVGRPPTAVRLLLDKRFLTSLCVACEVGYRPAVAWRVVYSVTGSDRRGII